MCWLTLVTISGSWAARALPARDAPAMARENFIVQREEKNWRMSVEKRRSVNQWLITKIVRVVQPFLNEGRQKLSNK